MDTKIKALRIYVLGLLLSMFLAACSMDFSDISLTRPEIESLSVTIGQVVGAIFVLGRLLKWVAPKMYQKIWDPIRKRITTKGDILRAMNNQNEILEEIRLQRNPESIVALRGRVDIIEDGMMFNALKIHDALEHTPFPLAYLDSKGMLAAANKPFRELFCRELVDLEGLGWQSTVIERNSESVARRFDAAVISRRRYHQIFNINTPPGNVICIEMSARPEVDTMSARLVGWRVQASLRQNNDQQRAA